jgi:tripartite-type tricarboxylate transporter receptor subunit TctC
MLGQQTITGGWPMHASKRAGVLAASIWLLFTIAGYAQDYPTREIHTICPFAAGTGADIIVRYYANKLSELAGKPVITDNRPGAQGLLGTEAVARARNDGYTISINPVSSTLAASPHIFKKLSFDPLKDLDPVIGLLSVSFVLVVTPNSGINSVAELTQRLKAKGTESFYAGSTNTGIVASELYKKATGIDAKRVNYRSALDSLAEMQSGKIDFFITDATSALGQIAGGKYKALAITSTTRSESFPGVPTMTEAGLAMDFAPWWSVVVPHGTPQYIVDRLAGWFKQISDMPETKAFLVKNGLNPMTATAEEVRELLVKDTARWGEWVKLANIEPN